MVDVPYHTHEFTIPTASEGEIRTGLETSKAITPDKLAPVLADKADKATTLAGYGIQDAASKAQGEKADTAVQPEQISSVARTGHYSDLEGRPLLGAAAALTVGTTADTVAAGDDVRIIGAVQETRTVSAGEGLSGGGNLAANIELALSSTTLASLALADSAIQPSALRSLAYKDLIATADIDATGSDDIDAILTKGGKWVKPTGVGDMLKAIYDRDNDGVVDAAKKAETADKVAWTGVKDAPVGTANGIAPLDANKKVPEVNLPALTTTATVGAATAAAASKQIPADSDFFSGVLAGGSTMFKTTWGNIKTTMLNYLQPLFDSRYLKLIGGTITGGVTFKSNIVVEGSTSSIIRHTSGYFEIHSFNSGYGAGYGQFWWNANENKLIVSGRRADGTVVDAAMQIAKVSNLNDPIEPRDAANRKFVEQTALDTANTRAEAWAKQEARKGSNIATAMLSINVGETGQFAILKHPQGTGTLEPGATATGSVLRYTSLNGEESSTPVLGSWRIHCRLTSGSRIALWERL